MSKAEFNLQNAASIWSMLDKMASEDPEQYKRFITQALQDGHKQGFCAPQIFKYIQTEKIPPLIPKRKCFINLVVWNQLKDKPNAPLGSRISVSGLREESIENTTAIIIDVAGHETFLADVFKTSSFAEKIIEHVTAIMGIELSYNFIIKDGYMGNKDCVYNLMCPNGMVSDAINSLKQGKEEVTFPRTDQRLACDMDDDAGRIERQELKNRDQCKPLTTKGKEKLTNEQPNLREAKRIPKHTLEVGDLNHNGNRIMKLEVDLPGITSVALCDLELYEDTILVSGGDLYEVQVPLPCKIDEDRVEARFIRKECRLVVTLFAQR